MGFQSNQFRSRKVFTAQEKERLTAYKKRVYSRAFQALASTIAEKVLPPSEAGVLTRTLMHEHEMVFSSEAQRSQAHGSKERGSKAQGFASVDTLLRAYFYTCRPSLTSRRKLFRTLSDFVNEHGWHENNAVSALMRELEIKLRLTSKKKDFSRNNRNTKAESNYSRPTFRARPQEAHSLPSWIKILGCAPNPSIEMIKRAYRKRVLELHPDRFQSKGLTDEQIRGHYHDFHELKEAYELAIATVKDMK